MFYAAPANFPLVCDSHLVALCGAAGEYGRREASSASPSTEGSGSSVLPPTSAQPAYCLRTIQRTATQTSLADEPGCKTLATYACAHFVVFGCAFRRYCADETDSQTRMSIIISFGIMNSFSLIVAHELCHSPEGTWKFKLGQALHATACRMHDPFEHNGVHHPQVATASDNGTARRGETVYAFIVRSTLLGHIDAYREHLQKHGNSGTVPPRAR